jgi:S1-C subfamily serine protease
VIGMASAAFSRHHGVVLPVATIERVLDELLAHGRARHGRTSASLPNRARGARRRASTACCHLGRRGSPAARVACSCAT